MIRLIRRCITQKPKGIDSQVVCCFGDERLRLGSQSFRKFNLPYLLRLSLFGEEYSNLHDNELVKKTARRIVLHIASMRRVKKLFTVENECGVSFLEINRTLSCCGKVKMKNRNGGNMLGYIIDETKLEFKIQLENNDVVWLDRIKWSRERKSFVYGNMLDCKWMITQYWPIRCVIISISGDSKLTLNRFAFNRRNNKIITSLTS